MSSSPTDASVATVEVTMPQMGVSVAEGTIIEWLKRPGDWVEADETVCDGDHRQGRRRDPLARQRAGSSGSWSRPTRPCRSGRRWPRSTPARSPGHPHPEEQESPAAQRARGPRGARSRARRPERPSAEEQGDGVGDRSGFYSPVVRRIADEHGIDLDQVGEPGSAAGCGRRTCSPQVEGGEAARSGRGMARRTCPRRC